MLDPNLNKPWWAMRLAYGLVPIIAGLDKFTNLLTDWRKYLSPWVEPLLPISSTGFMYAVGIIEIVAGIIVLSKFTRIGAYVVMAWLIAIALNLLTTGHYFDVAVRDLVMSVGAFTLAKMTELRERATTVERRQVGVRGLEPSGVGA